MSNFEQYEQILNRADIQSLASSIEPAAIDLKTKSSIKERVMNRIMAPCPVGGESSFAKQLDWVKITDNLDVKVLTQDLENKVQTAYWRLKPGAIVPGHYHNADEDCLVLEGDIQFGDHKLFAGDFHSMKKGTTHPDMITTNGALLYLKHDMHDDLSWLEV